MKFSIITPFYNNNKDNYIQKIYESVTNQTYSNFEWIITDDFSTDKTKQELLKLKDPRVKFIEQKFKKELFFNPQTYATGDIVIQLDSDDEMKPKSLEVYKYFFENNSDILFLSCVSNYVNENGDFLNNHLIYHGNFNNCLEKKIAKEINWIKSPMNFLKINGGWGNLQAWRNIDIDFNPYNYKNIVYMDKYRALTLEEHGKYLHIPRTLYVNTSRYGSISKIPLDYKQNIDDAKYFDKIKKRRKNSIQSYIKTFDEVFVEIQPFLYSKFNNESEKQNISVFYLDQINDYKKKLIQTLYFDHNIVFNEIENNNYYFFQIRKKEHIEIVKNYINKISHNYKEIIIQSTPYNYEDLKPININNYFNYKFYNEFYGFEVILL